MPIKFLNSGLLEGSLQLTSYGSGSIGGTGTYNLGVDASGNVIETSLIEGSGTTNYVVKWTPDGSTLGNSQIFDNGTNVGVGTNQPDYKLDVDGQIRSTSSSFPVYFLQRETSLTGDGTFTSTNGIASGFHLRTNSSATIQNGFGGGIVFSLTDSGTASNTAARIYARRDGSDTTGALQFWGGLNGTTILSTMRADGSVYFDEYGSGTFTGTAVKNLSITSSGKIIETDAVPANVVETVTTTDGTYINLTPNSPTDGAVTVTADLSAVDGTSGANERYLTKTNKWAEISTIPGTYTWSVDGDQGTPYTVNSGNTVDFAGSTYITTSTVSGPTLVITHDSTTRNNTTSSITPNFGSSFTAIDSITTNSTGHVTAVNTKTITLGTPVWFADADTGSEDIENGSTVTFVGGTGMDTSINSNFEITFTNTDRGSSQNIFKNVAVSGQSTIVADSNNDTLTFVAGSNVSITTNSTNDSITINAAGYTETDTLQSVTGRGASTTIRSIFTGGLNTNNSSTRDKISVYTGAPYVIGMQSGITYGHLNDWGMTFQFNNDSDRGFWWGDDSHSQAQGAMSLTTNGRLTVANSISVGQGEGVTGPSTDPLFVDGTAVFKTNTNSEPVCISRSGSTSSEVLKIGITDTQAQFIYIEDTSSEGTGNFGKYQFYLGGNAGESNIMPFEITKDNSLFSVPVKIESLTNPRLTIGDIDNTSNSASGAVLEMGNRISSGFSGGTTIDLINGLYSSSVINFKHGQATIGGDILNPRGQLACSYTGTANDYNVQLSHYNSSGGQDNYMSMRADYTYFNKEIRIGANSGSNGLDDYEEGSYNVEFYVNGTNYGSSNWVSGGGTVWTDSSQYIKVGRKVTLFFDLQYKGIPTAISSYTGQLYLTNLPFTMAHGGGGNIAFSWYNRNTTSSSNPQNLGGATRLSPNNNNQSTLINLEHLKYSSYWQAWYIDSMGTNYLPTSPPGGNVYMLGQFTYFTDN